jgi:hypothetical protein
VDDEPTRAEIERMDPEMQAKHEAWLYEHRERVLKSLEAKLVKAQREITPKMHPSRKRALGLALTAVRKGDVDGAVAILEEAA